MNASQNEWPKADTEALRDMWSRGLSAGQIAGRLRGYTRNAVIGKVRRLGLMRSRPATAPQPKPNPAPRPAPVAQPDGEGVVLLKSEIWKPLPGTTPVPLHDVSGCRWPVEGEGGALFCNASRDDGQVYCPTHRSAARRRVEA